MKSQMLANAPAVAGAARWRASCARPALPSAGYPARPKFVTSLTARRRADMVCSITE